MCHWVLNIYPFGVVVEKAVLCVCVGGSFVDLFLKYFLFFFLTVFIYVFLLGTGTKQISNSCQLI